MLLRQPSVEERIMALISDHYVSSGSIVNQILLMNKLNGCNNKKETFLMHSIYCRRTDIAYNLIKNGADVTLPDKKKNTALHYAISAELENEEKISLITALIRHGADIHAKNRYGKSPLMLAQRLTDPEIYELMMNINKTTHEA